MRLWHQDLINRLPTDQLNGQHRECCALRGLGWGKPHSTVNYVFNYNPARLVKYHMLIIALKRSRGHVWTDPRWSLPLYRGNKTKSWEENEFDFEWYESSEGLIYPEHNNNYMQSCLWNLERKNVKLLGG